MVELRRQRLVRRDHQRRAVQLAITCAMVKVLPEPVTPSSVCCCWPACDALDQRRDRARLIALRRVGALDAELRHGASAAPADRPRARCPRRGAASRIASARAKSRALRAASRSATSWSMRASLSGRALDTSARPSPRTSSNDSSSASFAAGSGTLGAHQLPDDRERLRRVQVVGQRGAEARAERLDRCGIGRTRRGFAQLGHAPREAAPGALGAAQRIVAEAGLLAVVRAQQEQAERSRARCPCASRSSSVRVEPRDFDILSPSNISQPPCIQKRTQGRTPSAFSDCAISLVWCTGMWSTPPVWMSNCSPRYFVLIAEHSMCQPGKPRAPRARPLHLPLRAVRRA